VSKTTGKISSAHTMGVFFKKGTCSETLFNVIDRAFDHPLTDEEHASAPLAGGIVQHGYQCGQIWGAAMAAGAQAFRLYGAGPHAETRAIIAAQRLVTSFRAQNNEINCLEITEIDKSSTTMQLIVHFLIKGGTIHCFRMAGKYAPVAFNEINSALSEPDIKTPPAPVSCCAMLARKMGASDQHALMAAGLAGGIGLCGGACGALATAIWIAGMRYVEDGNKITFSAPYAQDVINRFLKCTDYEFECSKIVGRQFASVSDHADFVRSGGCAKIIDALAAPSSDE
jgi:hypothetical protein